MILGSQIITKHWQIDGFLIFTTNFKMGCYKYAIAIFTYSSRLLQWISLKDGLKVKGVAKLWKTEIEAAGTAKTTSYVYNKDFRTEMDSNT